VLSQETDQFGAVVNGKMIELVMSGAQGSAYVRPCHSGASDAGDGCAGKAKTLRYVA